MATLLRGRALAQVLQRELTQKVHELPTVPKLGVVLIGDDPASHLYVRLKEEAAREVGITVTTVRLAEDVGPDEVRAAIHSFNVDPATHGILIQLPLPPHLDEYELILTMDASKDADGFHPQNLKRFLAGEAAVTPGVSEGILRLIDLAQQPLTGKQALLIVNSEEFAAPLRKLLQARGMEVNVHQGMAPPKLTRKAQILVIALGKPHSLTSEHISDGAIVVDVGTTNMDGRVLGDVDDVALEQRPIYLTPVPGGVGPMTVTMLLWNTYRLAQKRITTQA